MFFCNGDQKHNVGHTFTFFNQDSFVQICYTCLFSLLKVKKLDADDVNNKLREVCKFYLDDSTISRLNGHAKTCFEMLQTYCRPAKCKPDKAMFVCCFRCLKFFVYYILIFDLYVLAFKKGMFKIYLTVLIGVFLVKFIRDDESRYELLLTFCFLFGCYIGNSVVSYLLIYLGFCLLLFLILNKRKKGN